MDNPIQLDLKSALSDEHKQLLARLFKQEFKEGVVKLAHRNGPNKNIFVINGQEISLSHSIARHVDIATNQEIYAVYAHTYDQQSANGERKLNKEGVIGKGSNGRIKKVVSSFVFTSDGTQLAQNLNQELVVKIMPEFDTTELELKWQEQGWAHEYITKAVKAIKHLWEQSAIDSSQATAEIYKDVSKTTIRINHQSKKVAAYLMPFFGGGSGQKIIKKLWKQEQFRKDNNETIDLQTQIVNFIKSLNRAVAITQAVQNFHQDGFFHGDIKPDNIIIAENDSVAFLVDIGPPSKLGAKVAIGRDYTNGYVAPEMLNHEEKYYDAAADIYSLWVTLIEVLANARIQLREDGQYRLPRIKIPCDVDRSEKAKLFRIIGERALSEELDERPTTEEIMQFLVDLRAEYLEKLKEHLKEDPQKAEEFVKQLTPDERATEEKLARYENPKLWQNKLEDLDEKISLARRYIETAKEALIKKNFPNIDPEKNLPIKASELNPVDQIKFDCFSQMDIELEQERTKIADLANNKPADRTYRSLYEEKHQRVLAIVNKPENAKTLGKHQNIILGILNGVYKLLSRIFGSNQEHKMLGAASTMTHSAKELLKVKHTLQSLGMRK